jgi:serine/threonine protein kinase
MEDLQGGMLALEHRYRLDKKEEPIGIWDRYAGTAQPFDKKIWIEVADHSSWGNDPGLPQLVYDRLRESIVAAGGLNQIGVLRVIDFGEIDDNSPFIVTERTDSVRLDIFLQQHGTLPEDDVRKLMLRLVGILREVHEQGMNHGSLHPGCIFVPDADVSCAQIAHFGLSARMDEWRSATDPEMVISRLADTIVPPEVWGGDTQPSVEGDLYAVCAIAYRALVGINPCPKFETLEPGAGAIREYDLWQSLEDLGVDKALGHIIERGLTCDPGLRWTSFARLEENLVPKAAALGDNNEMPVGTPNELQKARVEEYSKWHGEESAYSETQVSPIGSAMLALGSLIVIASVGMLLFASNQAHAARYDDHQISDPIILVSKPDGADIVELSVSGEQIPLGKSPLVMPKKELAEPLRRFQIFHEGFQTSQLDYVHSDLGKEWTVHLVRKSPSQAEGIKN